VQIHTYLHTYLHTHTHTHTHTLSLSLSLSLYIDYSVREILQIYLSELCELSQCNNFRQRCSETKEQTENTVIEKDY